MQAKPRLIARFAEALRRANANYAALVKRHSELQHQYDALCRQSAAEIGTLRKQANYLRDHITLLEGEVRALQQAQAGQ